MFLRENHPILMDFGIIDAVKPLDASLGVPPSGFYEPARLAMGDTRRYALANPGSKYLALQPNESRDPIIVQLAAGTYHALTRQEFVTRAGASPAAPFAEYTGETYVAAHDPEWRALVHARRPL